MDGAFWLVVEVPAEHFHGAFFLAGVIGEYGVVWERE